jgi:hypothetical protein
MSETIKRMMKYPKSKAIQDLNPGFFNPTKETMAADIQALLPSKQPINDPGAIAPCFMRPSTDEQKLNKTEKAYLNFLRMEKHHWIGIQCISLKLGDDCRYNPDFLVINTDGQLQAHEVKGFMREDALVKLKTAARFFSFIPIFLIH